VNVAEWTQSDIGVIGVSTNCSAGPLVLQAGNEDVALETLIEPELLFAAGQVR
jgi:hypothetical protein